MYIYKITNKVNGKEYIGQTTSTITKRWREHCVPDSPCLNIGRAIQKYGKENFTIDVIAEAESIEELNTLESYFIQNLNTMAPTGYNLRTGGNNSIPSEETRKRMSIAQTGLRLGRTPWNKGLSSWSKGKQFSESHKLNLKAANAGRLVRVIRSDGKIYESIKAAATDLNTRGGSISRVISGDRKSIRGFTFQKIEAKNVNNT